MGNSNQVPGNSSKRAVIKYKKPSDLLLTTFTWTRDSHGLFDYECKTLAKKAFKAQATGFVRRTPNDIGFTKDNTGKQGDQDLLKLSIKEGSFWISKCKEDEPKSPENNRQVIKDSGSLENDPWIVIKSFKANTNKGFKLHEGELIKLGRVKFRIRELKDSDSNQDNNQDRTEKQVVNTEIDNNISGEESFKKSPRVPKGSLSTTNQTCRICLSEVCEAEDPFITPCNCSGTMKYIHIKCLQTWLRSKLHTKVTGNTTFVYWKSLECELCKTPYPQTFDYEGKRYDIVEFERPNCAFVALEVISKDKNITRGVHIVKLEGKNQVRLGRGHDSDIRITDISVSRCHAIIRLEKGQFFLDDNNSKFGTLIHMNKPLAIQGDFNNISVQVGRSLINLTSKKSSGMSCFGFKNKSLTSKRNENDNGVFGDMTRNELNLINEMNAIHLNQVSNNNSPVDLAENENRSILSDEQNNSEEAVQVQDPQDIMQIPIQIENVAIHPIQVVEPVVVQNPSNIHLNVPEPEVREEGNLGTEGNERSFRNYIVY